MGLILISHNLHPSPVLRPGAGDVRRPDRRVCDAGRLHEAQHPYTRACCPRLPELGHPPRGAAAVAARSAARGCAMMDGGRDDPHSKPVMTIVYGSRTGAGRRAARTYRFHVRPGEAFGLVGKSGSGKSTVLRAIAGLDPARSGILIDGRRCRPAPRANRSWRRWCSRTRTVRCTRTRPSIRRSPRPSPSTVSATPRRHHARHSPKWARGASIATATRTNSAAASASASRSRAR